MRIGLGISCFVLLVVLWAIGTYGGWIKPLFLATPGRTLRAGIDMDARDPRDSE